MIAQAVSEQNVCAARMVYGFLTEDDFSGIADMLCSRMWPGLAALPLRHRQQADSRESSAILVILPRRYRAACSLDCRSARIVTKGEVQKTGTVISISCVLGKRQQEARP